MDMFKLLSTHLKEAGYNPFDGILRIEFQDGSIYDYQGVPEHVFRGLMSAGSHGKYFAEKIKDRYPYNRAW
ncbi:KTSC domain-containing protein [Planococcus lenghuensis]|uniref:KTSC domain-containing protein n=1 Tax=Planococcus lenghuensis TaxID=2213202 RepID=A0A1Q2L0M0_9BACL|nr:KTSC domain-containing protein [Planococcus lenghuensis]AQQ54005.1 hypothetical protein B0X71_13475 [Planococcus lenghuensis]